MTDTTSSPVRSSAQEGALTASDSTIYSPPLRGLYVETSGRLRVQFADLTIVNIETTAVGWQPMRDISKVMAATTAVVHGFR